MIYGNKYIHLSASDNTKWKIDNQGLTLYNKVRSRNAMQFGGEFNVQQLTSEVGVFAYNPNGDTTHGRVAIVPTDLSALQYSFCYFEYDGTKGLQLNAFTRMIIQNGVFYGSYYNDEIELYPSGRYNDRRIDILYRDYSEQNTIPIFGYYKTSSGNTESWDVMAVKLYGKVVSTSSRKMKKNIKALTDVGNIIDNLEPVSFVYKDDRENRNRYGLIYEDTKDILPEICDEMQDKEGHVNVGINYAALTPVLLKEIQELRKRVAELERKVNK